VSEKPKLIDYRDRVRLCRFIEAWEARLTRDRKQIARLRARLRAAVAAPAREVPPTVVTMNTQVRVRDLDSGCAFVWTVVLPTDDEVAVTAGSPFSWSGATLLGAREGDELQWESRRGLRRVRIEAVLCQPEAPQRTQSRLARRARGERKIVPDVRTGLHPRRRHVSTSGLCPSRTASCNHHWLRGSRCGGGHSGGRTACPAERLCRDTRELNIRDGTGSHMA